MKTKLPVLEYSVTGTSPANKWTFRFKTPEGKVLIESRMGFCSQAEAEQEFVSLMKSIAANEYKVESRPVARNASGSSGTISHFNGRCASKKLRLNSRGRSVLVAAPSHESRIAF